MYMYMLYLYIYIYIHTYFLFGVRRAQSSADAESPACLDLGVQHDPPEVSHGVEVLGRSLQPPGAIQGAQYPVIKEYTSIYMGASINRGPKNEPQCILALNIDTTKMRLLIFGSSHPEDDLRYIR